MSYYDEVTDPDERNWAMASHLGSILTAWFALGLVAPLLTLLIKGGSSPFVRRHAVESLNFQLNALVWSIVLAILFFVLIGFLLVLPYLAFYVICVVLGTVRASAGEDFRYPLTLRVVT